MAKNAPQPNTILPKAWRLSVGLSLAKVANHAGLLGSNSARTYFRYESGEILCPTAVVEAVRKLSAGVIGPEQWHATRLAAAKPKKTRAA